MNRSFKIKNTTSELTASQITEDALLILKSRNTKAWRQNNLTVRHRKGIVTKGVPDILFYNKSTGLFGGCEVKKIGDTLSEEQHKFLFEMEQAGCIALIATERNGKTVLIHFNEFL